MNAVIQGSLEWFQARSGLVTASRMKDVLAKIRTGEAATRKNYKAQIVVERLTGKPQETYSNAAMQYGIDTEPEARNAYEFFSDNKVEEVGFIQHQDILMGCSPDGLIGKNGGVELKCPYQSAVHIETLLNGMPPEHIPQIQTSMYVTGRKWWEFVSYDPRLPHHLQLYIQQVKRDQDYIDTLERKVILFLDEVSELEKRLLALDKAK